MSYLNIVTLRLKHVLKKFLKNLFKYHISYLNGQTW